MIRIHLTPSDLARARIAARPAPIQELNAALMMLTSPSQAPLMFSRWRQRAMRALPVTALPLRDLVPGRYAPAFLDSTAPSLEDGFAALRAIDTPRIAAELERAYAPAEATLVTPPHWIKGLHRGAPDAWQPVIRAERAAFNALLAPVWPLIQDLHRAEFARHAATAAQHGLGHALAEAIPGSRLNGGTWELPMPDDAVTREIHPAGRGLLLLPTFHWIGPPLIADAPGQPVTVTYPAGSGLPPSSAATTTDSALADVLGRTRLRILMLTGDGDGDGLNTSALARRLGLSAATISVHTAALRAAGLITSARDGKAVVHRRTALGNLLLGTHATTARPCAALRFPKHWARD